MTEKKIEKLFEYIHYPIKTLELQIGLCDHSVIFGKGDQVSKSWLAVYRPEAFQLKADLK